MSADNWANCPKCNHKNADKRKAIDETVAKSYGLVSATAYSELQREADMRKAKLIDDGETLREDYEIGVRDGGFSVGYMAGCDRCGFRFKYEFKQEITL